MAGSGYGETQRGGAGDGDRLIPARYSAVVAGMFERHARSLFRRRFHAVRFVSDTLPVLSDVAEDPRPLIIAMNHSSWWDPLVLLVLRREYLSDRVPLAPMDREQLEKFGFLRRIGIFGVDPDDGASLEAMGEYVGAHLRETERAAFMITPQGRFADPRTPVRIRPGVSSIAAGAVRDGLEPSVVSLSIEYAFWLEKKPEVFLRVERCAGGHATTTGWHREISEKMQRNADVLADLVIARDAAPFSTVSGGGGGVNPIVDLLLRLRGRDPSLGDSRRGVAASDGPASAKAQTSEDAA